MSETLDATTSAAPKRPAFLTVLCILTFIGSGWGIVSALAFTDAGLKEYASYYYWVVILLNLGTLVGALLMWKLKKNGLYLYTLSTLAAIVLMWVVIKGYIASLMAPALGSVDTGDASLDRLTSNMGAAMVESAMNLALILGTVVPVLFMILYWVNAKHMKK